MSYHGQKSIHTAGGGVYTKEGDYELMNNEISEEDEDAYPGNEFIGDGRFVGGNRDRNVQNWFPRSMPHRVEPLKMGSYIDKYEHSAYGSHNPCGKYYSPVLYPNRGRPMSLHTHGDVGDYHSCPRSCAPRCRTDVKYRAGCLVKQAYRQPLGYDVIKSTFDKNYDMETRRKYKTSSFPIYISPDDDKPSPIESKISLLPSDIESKLKLVEPVNSTEKKDESSQCNVRSDKKDANEKLIHGESDMIPKVSETEDSEEAEQDYGNYSRSPQKTQKESESERKKYFTLENDHSDTSNDKFLRTSKIKESARSNKSRISTLSKKQFTEMTNLERSKCNALSAIDDGLQRIDARNDNLTAKTGKTQSHIFSGFPVTDSDSKMLVGGIEMVRSDFIDKMFKECRSYHLENMKQEIKRIQYLDSLPEKWEKQTKP